MNPFSLTRAGTYDDAGALLASEDYALPVLKAGGMDLVDHMKEGLLSPDLVIDVKRTRRAGHAAPVSFDADTITIEAGATLAEIGASEGVRRRASCVARACLSAATPQVRNVASAAGNLLQRPRCWYYRSRAHHCLKKGGHECFAFPGENAYHAIFGDGPCHIVHPSNLAVALVAMDATVHLVGGQRATIGISDLFHMPDRGIRSEHVLEDGEIITHMTMPGAAHSGFYAVKAKQSFDWPMAMAAVSLVVDGGSIRGARVCAGAVAPIPWRLEHVERSLAGVAIDDEQAIARACADAAMGAKPMRDNAYKVRLLPVVVRRAVLDALGKEQG